jgi:hypothetical protein
VPPVLGVQKPPRRVGKRFRDCRVAAPMEMKEKRPAGLRTRPAWLLQDRLGASPAVWSAVATRAARRGVRGRASLEAADGDHLIPRPDSDGEGAGTAAQDRVGAIVERLKGWNQATPTDPDEGGGE